MLDLLSNGRFWNSEDENLPKSQTLSLELKLLASLGPFLPHLAVSVPQQIVVAVTFLKTEIAKAGFYTRDKTKSKKRININSFLFVGFFALKFKIRSLKLHWKFSICS